jgi:uncharacterized protein (TIGR03545 family)
MIRKSGLLVFLALLAVVLAMMYLFAGFALRLGMVYSLEKVAGAEVNIDKVSVSLAPLALNIHGLEITDKNLPTHNSVSFDKAQAALELWPALLGYYVVNDLSLDGLEFGAERKQPGKVYRGKHADADEQIDLSDVLKLDIPDAEELMARVNLQATGKGEALREQIAHQQAQLDELKSKLPKQENLDKLQAQIKTLTDSKIENAADLANKAEQLKALQDQLKTERENVQKIKAELASMRDQLNQSVADLRAAGEGDWQRLKALANIEDGGLAPLSQILLGDFWGEKIAQIESFYRLVKPYIPEQGGKGAGDIESQEPVLPNRILPLPHQPYPDFLIKQARLQWHLAGGEALIQVQNITAQHALIGSPTTFNLDVEQLPRLAAFRLNGDFAILESMITNLTWDMQGLELNAFTLGRGENALQLTDGLLASDGSLKLINDTLTQQAEFFLRNSDFSAAGNRYMEQLADLLSRQDQIPLRLAAEGLLSNPDISVRSSLDKIIGDALLGEAREKLATLETRLRSQLDDKIAAELGDQPDWLAALNQQDGELDAIQDNIEEMLNAKLADATSGAKDRLKDTLLKRRQDD